MKIKIIHTSNGKLLENFVGYDSNSDFFEVVTRELSGRFDIVKVPDSSLMGYYINLNGKLSGENYFSLIPLSSFGGNYAFWLLNVIDYAELAPAYTIKHFKAKTWSRGVGGYALRYSSRWYDIGNGYELVIDKPIKEFFSGKGWLPAHDKVKKCKVTLYHNNIEVKGNIPSVYGNWANVEKSVALWLDKWGVN